MSESLPLVIRRARPDEAPALTDLCRAAKRHWGYPSAWMEAWADDLRVTPEYLCAEPVLVAERDGQTIGFAGLRRDAGQCWLEHLWLEPAHLGRGVGRELFAAAVSAARQLGVRELHIRSDPNAEPFYLRMGAVRRDLEIYTLLGKHRREVPLLVYLVPAS